MKIKNKLFMSAGISIILVVIIISLVLETSNRLGEIQRKHEVFSNLSNSIAELNLVTYEYLLHREKRMEQQWQSKYNSLKEIMDEVAVEQETVLIRTDFTALYNLFFQITANSKEIQKLIQEGAPQERIDIAAELEERLMAQLLVISHSIITNVSVLSEQKRSEEIETERLFVNMILILMIILAIAAVTSSLLVARNISKPLTRLANYSRRVGGGEYMADLEIKGKDEIASVASDVKSMVEQLRKHREHLEELVEKRTSKLTVVNKELEAFSYSVSHDLRAPLRSIDGFSQVLLEDYDSKLDKQGKDSLNRIKMSTKQMSELIDDLLRLSRITRKKVEYRKVDLSRLASSIAKDLKLLQIERKVNFTITPKLVVKADDGLMRVLLENLLGNAYKFTKNKANAEIEMGTINVNGGRAYFISDNGVGLDMAYADKLFSPFQRLHSSSEFDGTGIGLATVQRIIHLHNGKVWADSKVGKGATFYFTL